MTKLKICGLVALIIVAVGSSLQALPVAGSWTIYYSDSTFETVVGENYHGCDGSERWGDVSGFFETESWYCANGENIACSVNICNGNVDQYGQYDPGACSTYYCTGW